MGLTIGSAPVAVFAGLLVRGIVKKIAANKKKAEERAVNKATDSAVAGVQADKSTTKEAAAKVEAEARAAAVKAYSDFLTSLEAARTGIVMAPVNAEALKQSIAEKTAAGTELSAEVRRGVAAGRGG